MTDRLYVDNAATSFPKPPVVHDAMRRYAESVGASAGRGAYHEAVAAGQLIADCRARLAALLGATDPNQFVFTLNCSEALNLAIKGILRTGDHVVATTMEHNSVLRPLNALRAQRRIDVTYVQADAQTGLVDPDSVFDAMRPQTRLVCVLHASNVTGSLQPIDAIGPEVRRRGAMVLVDAAQTVGHVPIDVNRLAVDFLAMPGHKSLLGPLGTGALYIRPGLEPELLPLVEGGTGSISERPIQPDFMPDKFESGSHNAVGLAGLAAALDWIADRTVIDRRRHDVELCEHFLQETADADGLTVYGPRDPQRRTAVFSVRIDDLDPEDVSERLEAEHGILTRSGIHCAPLAHATIGTHDQGGTTRLSFGSFNTPADVDRCAGALAALAGQRVHA